MDLLHNLGFLLLLGLGYESVFFARKLNAYVEELIHWRFSLRANPRQFWQQHCQESSAWAKPRLLWGSEFFPAQIQCRHQIYWRSEGEWLALCKRRQSKALFTPRYYHFSAVCRFRYGRQQFKVGESHWHFRR